MSEQKKAEVVAEKTSEVEVEFIAKCTFKGEDIEPKNKRSATHHQAKFLRANGLIK